MTIINQRPSHTHTNILYIYVNTAFSNKSFQGINVSYEKLSLNKHKINSTERPRQTIILKKLCVLVCPSAGNMSSKQVCSASVEYCPNLLETLG